MYLFIYLKLHFIYLSIYTFWVNNLHCFIIYHLYYLIEFFKNCKVNVNDTIYLFIHLFLNDISEILIFLIAFKSVCHLIWMLHAASTIFF